MVSDYISRATQHIEAQEYANGLDALDKACLLVDPSLGQKMHYGTSGFSQFDDSELVNISLKWRLMRVDCLIGVRQLDEANIVAS
jgi:hypothetical protein